MLQACLEELYPGKHTLLNERNGLLHHAEVTMPDGSKKLVQAIGGPDLNQDFANLEAQAVSKATAIDLLTLAQQGSFKDQVEYVRAALA